MGTSRGMDVSSFQGPQDWNARKKEGIVFAFAKASEGERTHDARFATHITGIKAAGLVPGGYHFAWVNQDVNAEAGNYIAAVKPYAGPGFIHWLDLERRTDGANYRGVSAAQIRAWAAKWIALVGAAFPWQRVGVYTSGSDLSAGHVPTGTVVWYPAYPGRTVDTYAEAEAHAKPKPSGWVPLIWQFTSRDPNGASLDRSICYLSPAELRTWAAGTIEEDPMAGITKADIFDAVWNTDKVVAPKDNADIATNPTWAPQTYLRDIDNRVRAMQATEAAQNTTIAKLVLVVTALSANTAAIDPKALVAEIQAAIDNVTIHLTTS